MNKKKKQIDRYTAFFLIIALVYSLIAYKLSYLQIVKSEQYKERANNTAITEIPDAAPRGNIIDRNGVVLATNKQSYMLVYNETPENKKYFFQTMDKLFEILDENKEQFQDELELKINPYRFEFKSNDENVKKAQELRFKKDRGLDEKVKKQLFPGKKDKLTEEEKKQIDRELLKISPEETYSYLIEQYGIYPREDFLNLLNQYKVDKDEAYKEIIKRFNIQPSKDFKNKLEEYSKSKTKDAKKIYEELISKYGIDKMEYDKELQRKYMIVRDTMKMQRFSGYKPVIIASNIEKNTAFIILERLNELPGIDVSIQPLRYYPYGELGSAFMGYISKISGDTEKYKEKGYDVNSDYVGVAGIESVFEDRLKGAKGGRIVKLNQQGRIIEELGRREPYPGQTLKLTIDKEVQRAAEETLDKVMEDLRNNPNQSYDAANTANATRGAAVVVDVRTGGILALVSRPGYDPNIFAVPGKLTTELYNKFFNPDLEDFAKKYIAARNLPVTVDELFPPLNKDTKSSGKVPRKDEYDIYPKPFFNYATSSFAPPGSTFKPLTAIAGLEEGVITPEETIYDNLIYTKHGYRGKSWNASSKGNLNVIEALAYSNNYYFFEVGDRLYQKGLDTLAKYAWKFGLGTDPNGKESPSTGIEIPENFGQVFNVQSEKNKASNIYMWNLYDELKTIKNVEGKNQGINIQINEDDSEDIKELKGNIQDIIRNEMRYGSVKDFSKKIEVLLKELVDKDSKLKEIKFTNGDISKAVNKINISVNGVKEEATRPGNVYNASIGQGSNYFTPLQLANFAAMIANGGTRYSLHLVDEYLDPDNNVIQKIKPEVIEKIDIKPENLKAVKEGMYAVTSYDEGTGSSYFKDFPIKTGGKTGSATFNEKIQEKVGRTSGGVYIGFAPYDNPEIAISVMVLDGAHGGYVIPVAKAVYESYFKEELKKQNYNFQFYKEK
ncbi:penicillin-binding protein [Clostridium cochlearium]|uniref:penicillin-binding transpeptidase domain-containing protein n=1 Tax=Clostridium cochlearium TaxID=1494 RepID=UPI0014595AB8|nr:penicillin-binding transpeptidase domain-containing protein [Clostridium cochlearium]NME94632.1 penicillin-binding protein [Clostridium cochlearium]